MCILLWVMGNLKNDIYTQHRTWFSLSITDTTYKSGSLLLCPVMPLRPSNGTD